jgi:ADP-dependent NAD(P)H-hydrate dehydratase / NAD(P)H-hydrate epimerase
MTDLEPRPIDAAWVAEHLPERPERAHKGTFGRVLIAGGSLEYAGALVLAGLGAARAGAGLVSLASAETVGSRLLGLIPEATTQMLTEEAPGLIAPAGWRRLAVLARNYDAVVVGPGLGRQPNTLRRTRGLLSEMDRPAVVDADALNALAESDRWWRTFRAEVVLTPHPGEFARLIGRSHPLSDDDGLRAAAALEAAARWGQVVVLKGARTVVATPNGALFRSEVATPALATAGSGDVLAGVIGALLASGSGMLQAATCGVAVHGRAGELDERRIGRTGTLARDIAGLLPQAITGIREEGA